MDKYRVAAIQMVSSMVVAANLAEAAHLIEAAAKAGARLVVLPENFAFLGKADATAPTVWEPYGKGPIQGFLAEQAKRHRLWLVGGTVALESDKPRKVRAACLLYDDQGEVVARYDKMHLFDVSVPGDHTNHYQESLTIDPGNHMVVAETPLGKIGLAVCYDLRFPELFRAMVVQGMELIAVPAAFTAVTGAAHWEVLLRARAIENLSYVVASAQGGEHMSGRETYGDSLIVDPWGSVLARLPRGAGFIACEIDRSRVRAIREQFPAIDHRRFLESAP